MQELDFQKIGHEFLLTTCLARNLPNPKHKSAESLARIYLIGRQHDPPLHPLLRVLLFPAWRKPPSITHDSSSLFCPWIFRSYRCRRICSHNLIAVTSQTFSEMCRRYPWAQPVNSVHKALLRGPWNTSATRLHESILHTTYLVALRDLRFHHQSQQFLMPP